MPTNLSPTSRFAALSAAQVIDEQTRILARYAVEDIERQTRHAAILASFGGR